MSFLINLIVSFECFSSYPFPRACILNDIKQVDKGIWIFSETLAEAVAEIEKISQP